MTDSQPPSGASTPLLPGEPTPSLRPQRVVSRPLVKLLADLPLLGASATAEWEDIHVTGMSLDSRTVRPGDLYLALPGAKTHGAHFAKQAAAAGAVAVLTDSVGAELIAQEHRITQENRQGGIGESNRTMLPVLVVADPRRVAGQLAARIYRRDPMLLIGITGTNGKTTVSYLVRSLLAALGRRSGLVGTVETLIGEQRVPSPLTTPESPDLHALLARMSEEGLDAAVVEVSSHALTFGRVDGVRFDVAGFTNLSQDHLDLHGDMESYLAAKAQLFTAERSSAGVVVTDQEWGRRLAAGAKVPLQTLHTTQISVEGLGGQAPGGETAQDDRPEAAGWQVTSAVRAGLGWQIRLGGTDAGRPAELCFRTSLPGRFNIANAALAVLLVHCGGVSVQELQCVLDEQDPLSLDVSGRMQVIGRRPTAIVDFAHNPEGLRQALEAVRPAQGRLITVFGATGERDLAKRPVMGAIAVRGSDVVIVTDDDPHDEDPAQIREQVVAGAEAEARRLAVTGERRVVVENVAPRTAAIDRGVELAEPQDTVLIAGRGHEVWQEVRGVNLKLDDRQELRAALTRHGFDAFGQPGLES